MSFNQISMLHRKGLAPSTPCRSLGASHMFSGMALRAAGSEPCRHLRSTPRPGKMTNSSILTIRSFFALADLSTLPPSCGFGDVILFRFEAQTIRLKKLVSSTASRSRGQSYLAVRSFPAPFEPRSFSQRRQFAPVAVRL